MEEETIVVFDFDGTITRRDTLLEFIRFTKGRWRLYAGMILFSPVILGMKAGLCPNWKVKEQLFIYFYQGTPLDRFNRWGQDFCSEINKMLRPDVIEIMERHQNAGNRILIISASIENWILPWAQERNIDQVLSTRLEVGEDRMITGRFLTANCYGKEKVNRLLAVYPHRQEYHLVVYGDSKGDRELIAFADEGNLRKPTQRKKIEKR